MEAKATESGGQYHVEMTLTEKDLQAFLEVKGLREIPQPSGGFSTTGFFGSNEYCVTVCNAGGVPFYSETIKTQAVWAYVRGYAIMKEHNGSGFQLRAGHC
jgi:hypothetical protein